ncbi:YolD-like family protein [Brevibacillus sp. AG]|uniref:YolD-like family protein n=1 Tax=Brevibacillus sp. AG TaxID=3020891 RepID=UPI00232CFA63|nr:YolD-like family protein [Brevibacillus sp. AG]MDC0764882.1 YolD-like family protein [Brevibacillus sp. AG]
MAKKIDNLFGSSRFVLPEQRELYLQMKEDDKLVPMPVIEQDEHESFDYRLREAQQSEKAVSITWWQHKKNELGTICTMWGAVPGINENTRKVKLLTVEDVQWIPMDTIIDVRS